jgi:hypothetical protein
VIELDCIELDKRLKKAIDDYRTDISTMVKDEYSHEPVTEGEMVSIVRDVFYLANDFREAIIEYLKSN